MCLTKIAKKKPVSTGFIIFAALPKYINMYDKIEVDRDKLTIMGVQFSDLKTLENTANAIGSFYL